MSFKGTRIELGHWRFNASRGGGYPDPATIFDKFIPLPQAPCPTIGMDFVVSPHAIKQFRERFPLYCQDNEDSDLMEDLRDFVLWGHQVKFEEPGRKGIKWNRTLVCYLPIWDHMKVVVGCEDYGSRNILTVITVEYNEKPSYLASRTAYSAMLLNYISTMPFGEIRKEIQRVEQLHSRVTWGMPLLYKDNPRVVIAHADIHDIANMLVYRELYAPSALSVHLRKVCKRLHQPVDGWVHMSHLTNPEGQDKHSSMFEHMGIWVSPAAPLIFDFEILESLYRRVKESSK